MLQNTQKCNLHCAQNAVLAVGRQQTRHDLVAIKLTTLTFTTTFTTIVNECDLLKRIFAKNLPPTTWKRLLL